MVADRNLIYEALKRRQFFKLICGGSFSDTDRLKPLITAYAQAGAQMIDVSADAAVVDAAIETLHTLPKPPMLMVSFPLDSDPHFRKIILDDPACITCGDCLPVCPTQVFNLNQNELTVDEPACYGCGRCVPACPTDALSLDAFSVRPDLISVLKRPEVQAVEIHTTYADPAMLESLYAELAPYLENKLIAICLRPQTLPPDQVHTFLHLAQSYSPFPIIVQVDGDPMSGSDDPKASLPALKAARDFALSWGNHPLYLTISGGINTYTASYLAQPEYNLIQGVGVGTTARKAIWQDLGCEKKAAKSAIIFIAPFLNQSQAFAFAK